MRKHLFFSLIAGSVGYAWARRRAGTPIFIGTQGDGIFAARLDERTGELASLGLAAKVERPTWLLHDSAQSVLYAVSEVGNAGDREGAVLSFAVDRAGESLRPIGRTGSGGGGATHLGLDQRGETIFVANFGGGTVAAIATAPNGALGPVVSIRAHDGSGPHRRQPGPRPHGVTLAPSRRFLLAPDMGADRLFIHRYDPARRTLAAHDPAFISLPPGSGPRLVLFGPDGDFAYLLTELSTELFTFRWDAAGGRLEEIDRRALDPVEADYARSAAAITISRDGRFLYLSNRATNAIHVFAIDRRTGLPNEIQVIDAGGAKPWDLALAPTGRWLLASNQGSDMVAVFRVGRAGRLSRTPHSLAVPTPTCATFG